MLPRKLIWSAALVGLTTSMAIHMCALLGFGWVPEWLKWILSIGVFCTGVPATLLAGLDDKSVTIQERYIRIRQVLAACPATMRYGTMLIFLYGIATMITGMDMSFGRAFDKPNGIVAIRSLSAVWSAFYAVALSISYSLIRSRERHGDMEAGRDDGPSSTNEQ